MPIVFFAALAEATVGVGVVVPGVVLMFLAGAYTAEQGGVLPFVFVIAVAGTLIGDMVSYGLGRWGSRRVAGSRFRATLEMGQALISGHTRWLIPFYHLHSVTRAVGPFGSGALRLPLRVWMPLDFAGAVFSNAVWVGTGAFFGQAVLTERGTLEPHPALRIGIVVAATVWFLLVQQSVGRRLRELRAERVAEKAPAP